MTDQLVVTTMDARTGRKAAFYVRDGRIVEIFPEEEKDALCAGDLCSAVVTRVLPAKDAAFLRIGEIPCFMNLGGRRPKAGSEMLVRVKKEAHGTKLAAVVPATVPETVSAQKTCASEKSARPFYERAVRLYGAGRALSVVTDDRDIYDDLLRTFPERAEGIRLYAEQRPSLGVVFGIAACMKSVRQRKIWLKDGGFLVFDRTEAFHVIDVNSGKHIAGREKEQAIYETNRNAAAEIAVQLRLRNLSGVILIDFISMEDKERKKRYLDEFRGLLRKDPAKPRFVDETALQIVELTRRRGRKEL